MNDVLVYLSFKRCLNIETLSLVDNDMWKYKRLRNVCCNIDSQSKVCIWMPQASSTFMVWRFVLIDTSVTGRILVNDTYKWVNFLQYLMALKSVSLRFRQYDTFRISRVGTSFKKHNVDMGTSVRSKKRNDVAVQTPRVNTRSMLGTSHRNWAPGIAKHLNVRLCRVIRFKCVSLNFNGKSNSKLVHKILFSCTMLYSSLHVLLTEVRSSCKVKYLRISIVRWLGNFRSTDDNGGNNL